MERLTVLMPARNAARTLQNAAATILTALPRGSQLLVFDDASSDGTTDILSALARSDGRVGILRSETNVGVAAALNALIEEANTPLIARMDADDLTLPWRFRREVPLIESGKIDVVFTPMIMFGHLPQILQPQTPVGASPLASAHELLIINSLSHPTLTGRRSAFRDCGGYRCVAAEDWDMWLRMTLHGYRLARVATPSLLYRRHGNQVSVRRDWFSAETASAHSRLASKLIGLDCNDAFRALCSQSAGSDAVQMARELISAVAAAGENFRSVQDRLSVKRAVSLAQRRLKKIYG